MNSVFWPGLLHNISISLSSCFRPVCLLSQFYFTFSFHLPLTKPDLRYLHSCTYAKSGSRQPWITAVGTGCADHETSFSSQKLELTSPISGGSSVGIVRLRTKCHGIFQYQKLSCDWYQLFLMERIYFSFRNFVPLWMDMVQKASHIVCGGGTNKCIC
jgi:hypothetical protein